MRNIGEWGKCSRLIIRSFARFDLGAKQSSSSVHSALLGYSRVVLYLSRPTDISMKVSLVYRGFSDVDWPHKLRVLYAIKRVLRSYDGESLSSLCRSLRKRLRNCVLGTPLRVRTSEVWISPDIEPEMFGVFTNPPENSLNLRLIYISPRTCLYMHCQFQLVFI
jgi:hypothetical protein